ncbi:MAG: hypothetical protein M3R53_00585 [Candidatus Eremiobacteraeota bacterium]|nr:hypothetical protein [Candidatus Eremiobacteraeota bacterium]
MASVIAAESASDAAIVALRVQRSASGPTPSMLNAKTSVVIDNARLAVAGVNAN